MGIKDENAPATPIELQVNLIGELFQSFDRPKCLNKDVEDYIVSLTRMRANNQPIKIIVHLPEKEAHTRAAKELAKAFAQYFSYHATLLQHDLDELHRDGRRLV